MGDSKHSEVLWAKIRLAENRLLYASAEFWTHEELPLMLPAFLIQLHRVMTGGLSLMTVARDRARIRSNDEVASICAAYLDTHIAEESDHDEWLLSDLESIGVPRDEVIHAQPLDAVASLLGKEYFWIFHAHPVAVFGYLIVLEGYAPLSAELDRIRINSGYPESAFRCLQAHAENDPHHIADLNATLDGMPLSAEQTMLVALSAFHTMDAVATIFEELIQRHAHSPSAMSLGADAS